MDRHAAPRGARSGRVCYGDGPAHNAEREIVMQQILRAWRSAERQLDATFEGSLERRQIQAQVATLRALYQGLFAQVRHGLTERAPF
jgi:hypothetical protein